MPHLDFRRNVTVLCVGETGASWLTFYIRIFNLFSFMTLKLKIHLTVQ
jgi:hypothetical protein